MSVEILKNDAEWNSFLKVNPCASVYHTLKWRDIIRETFHYQPLYLLIRDNSGNVIGVCPGFIKNQMHFWIYDSIPYSDYGGPFIDEEFRREGMILLRNFLQEYCSNTGIDYAKFYLLEEDNLFNFQMLPFAWVERPIGVMEVDLKTTSPDFLWNKVYSRTQRKRVRRIERDDFQLQEAKTKSDFLDFYASYVQTMEDINGSADSYRLLENIWNTLYPSNLRLWILRSSKIVGAEFFLKTDEISCSRYEAIDRRQAGSQFSPSNFLRWVEIKKAFQEGKKRVSFGTTSIDPTNSHYLQKKRAGASFHPQQVLWYPFTATGYALLRARRKLGPIWKDNRAKLPVTVRKLMEEKLLRL